MLTCKPWKFYYFSYGSGYDFTFGEPTSLAHPVAWPGRLVSPEMKQAPRSGRAVPLVSGAIMILVTPGTITAVMYGVVLYFKEINRVIYIIVAGVLLKFTFSLRPGR